MDLTIDKKRVIFNNSSLSFETLRAGRTKQPVTRNL